MIAFERVEAAAEVRDLAGCECCNEQEGAHVLFGVLRCFKCHKIWGAEAHVPGDDVDLFLAVSRTMAQSFGRKTIAQSLQTRTIFRAAAGRLLFESHVDTALQQAMDGSNLLNEQSASQLGDTHIESCASTSASPADPRTERVSHTKLAARLERPARPARDAAPSESIFRAEALQRY